MRAHNYVKGASHIECYTHAKFFDYVSTDLCFFLNLSSFMLGSQNLWEYAISIKTITNGHYDWCGLADLAHNCSQPMAIVGHSMS